MRELKRIKNESITDSKEFVKKQLECVESELNDVKKVCLSTVKNLNRIQEIKRLKMASKINLTYTDFLFSDMARLESTVNTWIVDYILEDIDRFKSSIGIKRSFIDRFRSLFDGRLTSSENFEMNKILDMLDDKYISLESSLDAFRDFIYSFK